MQRILFLGSNPSERSGSLMPFWHDTKSTNKLIDWIALIVGEEDKLEDLYEPAFANVADFSTPGNRPLKISEIRATQIQLEVKLLNYKPDKIIALGKTAQKALTLLGVQHFAMPHPSGLNRQLNDANYIAEKIKALKSYLEGLKN
jgi:uracil-DNA glycosylase